MTLARMKKEHALKSLCNFCFLLPGKLECPRGWYLTPLCPLSLVTLVAVIAMSVSELVGINVLSRDDNARQILSQLKHVPARPIGFCLKALAPNETLVEIEDANGVFVEVVHSDSINTTNSSSSSSSRRHPMSDLEDIVSTAYRFMIFGMNVVTRLFLWISFPGLAALFVQVFLSTPGTLRGEVNAGTMSSLWRESSLRWSTGEKVYLATIFFSLMQRQCAFFLHFYTSISNTGFHLLHWHCIVVQIVMEQAKVIYSREMALEIVAFALVVLVNTLVNVIATICEQDSEDQRQDEDDDDDKPVVGFFREEIGNGTKKNQEANILFVRTRAILMKNAEELPTIDKHISGILSNTNGYYEGEFQAPTNRKPKKLGSGGIVVESGTGGETSEADGIYAKINLVICAFFDLMNIWEQGGRFTGFVSLILFCELTTCFCFNTYITLDNTMKHGLFSWPGAIGVVRGVVIVTKLVCICNAAQTLRDMTPVILERVLQLKLKLLSLPVQRFRKGNNELNGGNWEDGQCARCRGLGSFLSEMVSYIRAHPFEVSALGYFTVSRSSLTTITGVIVTYLVVLVQFQSYASSSST